MRLQPPKTNGKYFNFEEFKSYALSHVIVPGDIPIKEFFISLNHLYDDKGEAMSNFLTLWPWEYHRDVRRIFGELEIE